MGCVPTWNHWWSDGNHWPWTWTRLHPGWCHEAGTTLPCSLHGSGTFIHERISPWRVSTCQTSLVKLYIADMSHKQRVTVRNQWLTCWISQQTTFIHQTHPYFGIWYVSIFYICRNTWVLQHIPGQDIFLSLCIIDERATTCLGWYVHKSSKSVIYNR